MYPASIKPDQPSLDRRRRPGELSIPARYASIQRVPTGIRAVSDPQLVGHRLAVELFENPRGGLPWGVRFGAHQWCPTSRLGSHRTGIKSVRNGFGDGGEWLWRLERRPASPVSKPVSSRTSMRKVLIQKKYRPACEHVAFLPVGSTGSRASTTIAHSPTSHRTDGASFLATA